MPNPPQVVKEYQAARNDTALAAQWPRGLLEVTGKDRAAWLHNLVTNVVKTLSPGDGVYAFAVNVKGRTLFDLNILALEDRLWLDVDRRQIAAALKHLERYIITEDVKIEDVTERSARVAVAGPRCPELMRSVCGENVAAMASLQHRKVDIGGADVRLVRHDFAGPPGVELYCLADQGSRIEETLQSQSSGPLERATDEALKILRIEAGIPASVEDIDEEVVPPETGQVERGISYTKGCYLGQEVIERMRSHGALARKLVGMTIEGDNVIEKGAPIRSQEAAVGRLTSCCWSEAVGGLFGLGYLKAGLAAPGTEVGVGVAGGEKTVAANVTTLPLG